MSSNQLDKLIQCLPGFGPYCICSAIYLATRTIPYVLTAIEPELKELSIIQ